MLTFEKMLASKYKETIIFSKYIISSNKYAQQNITIWQEYIEMYYKLIKTTGS